MESSISRLQRPLYRACYRLRLPASRPDHTPFAQTRSPTPGIGAHLTRHHARGPQRRSFQTAPCLYAASSQTQASVAAAKQGARESVQGLLTTPSVPTEEQVLAVLESIEAEAQSIVDTHRLTRPNSKIEAENSTSALLDLDGGRTQQVQRPVATPESPSVKKDIDALSELAFNVVRFKPVFLTPNILRKYVEIQTLLLRPETFPEVFYMYTHKPFPKDNQKAGSEIEYQEPDSKAIGVSIDSKVANLALDTAIHVKDLGLALDVIEQSFRTPSFERAKIFRKAIPPMVGAALMPAAAWTLASNWAAIQTGLSPEIFTQVAFAGITTYVLCVGTIGYVALTTANDQMKRVTWVEGTPLHVRWLREEERAALDRIALAWGFRQSSKWGEEEGEEWEDLKEWIGVRGMILDKVGLMEGMQ